MPNGNCGLSLGGFCDEDWRTIPDSLKSVGKHAEPHQESVCLILIVEIRTILRLPTSRLLPPGENKPRESQLALQFCDYFKSILAG